MDIVSLLIWLLIVVAAFGIVYYIAGLIPLPPPVRTIFNIVLAVIALIMLVQFATGGLVLHPLRI